MSICPLISFNPFLLLPISSPDQAMNCTRSLHLNPPFRAEHIGSLLRPAALFKMREMFEEHKCTQEQLKVAEDEAIQHVVKMQKDIGIKTITDGELRRAVFFEGVFDTLEGMTIMPNRPIGTFKPYVPHIGLMYASGIKEADTIFCTGKIRRTKPFFLSDFKYLKALVPKEEVKYIKVTICSPSWYHQRHGSDFTYDPLVYKCDDEYFDDLGIAYRAEISDLYEAGCRHIQIDDPTFCYFCTTSMISGMEEAGIDHEALLDTYIRAINVCTKGRPDDLTISIHLCRGNFKGGVHFAEGGYNRIAIKLFNCLDVDTFYLEYDTERAGDFSPLKHLPLNKVAVLGLVTTKNPRLESVGELVSRVHQAVNAMTEDNPGRSRRFALNQFVLPTMHQFLEFDIGQARLCISTQCGFASVWEGNPVTEHDQRKKLAVLVEAARQIWRWEDWVRSFF